MKTKLLLAAGLAAVSMASVAVHEARAVVSANGVTTAEIVAPIVLDCSTATLDFGQIIPDSGAPSTVAVDTTGAPTVGGGATSLGGTVAASCDLSGDAGIPADISISATTDLSDGPGGGADMTTTNYRLAYDGGAEQAAPIIGATLDPAGAPLLIGATLNVGTAQVAGVYNGTFTVEVDYQ